VSSEMLSKFRVHQWRHSYGLIKPALLPFSLMQNRCRLFP
jgi:hypothetical protein